MVRGNAAYEKPGLGKDASRQTEGSKQKRQQKAQRAETSRHQEGWGGDTNTDRAEERRKPLPSSAPSETGRAPALPVGFHSFLTARILPDTFPSDSQDPASGVLSLEIFSSDRIQPLRRYGFRSRHGLSDKFSTRPAQHHPMYRKQLPALARLFVKNDSARISSHTLHHIVQSGLADQTPLLWPVPAANAHTGFPMPRQSPARRMSRIGSVPKQFTAKQRPVEPRVVRRIRRRPEYRVRFIAA